MDQQTQALLVDLLNALVIYPHQLPPELIGRIVLAVGPHILTGPQPFPSQQPQTQTQTHDGITTSPPSWG